MGGSGLGGRPRPLEALARVEKARMGKVRWGRWSILRVGQGEGEGR